MSVSPQLLALMSVTPTRSGGVTSWSIFMDFRYPFPWETTAAFVLREKAKGPPDDMVTLEVDRNVFKYDVRMPWYARFVLGKSIIWRDVLQADPTTKTLLEDGTNMNLRKMGTVRDCSSWRACDDDPNVTLYTKRVDFDIRMPVGPTIMMQVAQPLIRWFRTKSNLCRELEVKAIRDFIEAEKGDSEAERAKRAKDDAAWMAALTVETADLCPSLSSPPSSPSSPEAESKESQRRAEGEAEMAQPSSPSSPCTASRGRFATAKAKAKDVASRAKTGLAEATGAGAAERTRPRTAAAADGST